MERVRTTVARGQRVHGQHQTMAHVQTVAMAVALTVPIDRLTVKTGMVAKIGQLIQPLTVAIIRLVQTIAMGHGRLAALIGQLVHKTGRTTVKAGLVIVMAKTGQMGHKIVRLTRPTGAAIIALAAIIVVVTAAVVLAAA